MLKLLAICLTFLSFSAWAAPDPEAFTLKTTRGTDVYGEAHFPTTVSGKVPAVIIAPGQGYHMELPLMREFVVQAAEQGVAAFRFNWSFFSSDPNNGVPSPDLRTEVEDMKTVLNFVKKDPRIDPNQIIIGGKSLGTFVSYAIFAGDPALKGLFLLTPVCSWHWDENGNELPSPVPVASQNYPGLIEQARPIVITLGNSDRMCQLPMLYDYLKTGPGQVSTVVVGGNHSLLISPSEDAVSQKRNDANIRSAVQITLHWVNLMLGR